MSTTFADGYDLRYSPHGPTGYEFGGINYIFAVQGSEFGVGDNDLHVLKSSDLGVTWSDVAHLPIPTASIISPSAQSVAAYCTCRDSDIVYILACDTAGGELVDPLTGPLLQYEFDLTTEAFTGPTTPSGPTIYKLHTGPGPTDFSANRDVYLSLIQLAPGSMMFLYNGTPDGGYARVCSATFDGSNFGGEVEVPGQSGSNVFTQSGAMVDLAGIAHIILETNDTFSDVFHVGFDGGWGTFQTVEIAAVSPVETNSNLIEANGELAFLVLAGSPGFPGVISVCHAASGVLNPTWTTTSLSAATQPIINPNIGAALASAIGFTNDIFYAFWTVSGSDPDWDVSDGLGVVQYSQSTDLLAWAGDATLLGPFPLPENLWATAQIMFWEGEEIGLGYIVASTGIVDAPGPTIPIELTIAGAFATIAHANCSITIYEVLSIECNDPPAGNLGDPYSHFPSVNGAPPGSTYTITAGELPPGIELNEETSEIAGTPTQAGYYAFAITVTTPDDSHVSVACSISLGYGTLTVDCTGGTATVGVPYQSRPLVKLGSISLPPQYDSNGTLIWEADWSSLPDGLMFDTNPLSPTFGYIVGTPTGVGGGGLYEFTFTVSTPDGQSVTTTCPIELSLAHTANCEIVIGSNHAACEIVIENECPNAGEGPG